MRIFTCFFENLFNTPFFIYIFHIFSRTFFSSPLYKKKMVSGHLSALLMDWTSAVTELNTLTAHTLLEKEPELLWTPIPQSLDDTDHLQDQLAQLNKLGSSFQPVSAIQFTLLHYRDMGLQEDRFKFLSYLIEVRQIINHKFF